MKAKNLICLTAAIVFACCATVGCADSSSGSSSKSDSSSSQSSGADSSSSSKPSADSSNASSTDNNSSEAVKANAIGYDAKGSKRLYDDLKSSYGEKGYKLTMKSTANMSTEHYLGIKNGKVSSCDKSSYSNKTMVYVGGDKMSVYDHTTKSFTEQKVDDGKALAAKCDILFGMTGDFIRAEVDENNDVINEYYKVKSDIAGKEGTICFTFRGNNASFAQITLLYDGDTVPMLFGITEIKECDDEVFNTEKLYEGYRKEQ